MPAMIDRRTALLTGLALACPWAGARAQTSPQDRADLARVEAYLSGIRAMKAKFVQTAPDGDIAHGQAFVQRPGRMRFQYDPPSPFLLVANYGVLKFHDASLRQTTNIPLSRTPLGILLGDDTKLSGDVTVTGIARLPGQLQLSLVRTASPGEGTLTLLLADEPMVLRGWIVVDQQGKQTKVTLTGLEPGARLDARLFDFKDIPDGSGGAAGGG